MCARLVFCAAAHAFVGGGSAMSLIALRLVPGALAGFLLPKACFERPCPVTGNETLVGSTWRGAMLACKSY